MTGNLLFAIKKLRYGDILTLPNLEVYAGRVTCIMGESGAGKSTLLKMMNKMLSPDKGEIYYKGTSLEDIDSIQLRRKVIMLSQTPLIFPGTIKENLHIGFKLTEKDSVGDEILEQAIHKMHLEKELNEDSGNLSGGEKQRLALARVLLLEAETYLLDEPTSALDEETELKVLGNFITEVKKKQASIIMITHSKKAIDHFGEDMIDLAQLQE
ncbi:ATP-binding cassette domain-containing protein [Bacillus sp. ISL-47]|uniref:ABC transporter ATP-binding protein n=1 Tax=Bacillus sp. ISL-47 TaxID=2819130 RepID=UPI001BE75F27|nr:ATP-binding cassette domain-containing protein [Bacillus sp. ISL-47]MBT2687806.1 ATP-binding cassette domain-containing protein [Bacillus sp. ISL-47]MBT2708117.1 ATP-binding cassette domain-containing protein [Pseudomonas sp. ISL-84]